MHCPISEVFACPHRFLWTSYLFQHAPSQRQTDGVAGAQATSSSAAAACWGNARGGLDARSPTSELMGISPALPRREPLQPRQMRGPDTPGHAEAVRLWASVIQAHHSPVTQPQPELRSMLVWPGYDLKAGFSDS